MRLFKTNHSWGWIDTTCLRCNADVSSSDIPSYNDFDLVEFRYNRAKGGDPARASGGATYLGVVMSSGKVVHPLGLRAHAVDDEDAEEVELFCDDSVSSIHIVSDDGRAPSSTTSGAVVVNAIDTSLICFSQRIVEDRVSNPHGEHAEDVWILSKSVLMRLWKMSDNPSYLSTID